MIHQKRRLSHDAKRVLRAAGSALSLPHRWLITRILILLSPKGAVAGFEIAALNDELTPQILQQLDQALKLIAHANDRSFRRISRDVRRILIVRAGGPEYWPLADGFLLNSSMVQQAAPSVIALTIVHEATHARLWRAGFRYHLENRHRIERICLRAEANFACLLSVPDSEHDTLRDRLANAWWLPDQIAERQARARRQLWPRWLVKLSQWIPRFILKF